MRPFAVVLSFLLRCLYGLLPVIFFVALFNIVKGHRESNIPGNAVASLQTSISGFSDYNFLMVDYVPTQPQRIGGAHLVSDISMSLFSSDIWLLAILCSVSFLLVYAGVPLYHHLTTTRPLRKIHQLHATGSGVPLQSFWAKESVKTLYERTTAVLQYKESATQLVNELNKDADDVAVDESSDSLAILQQRLAEISEGEKASSVINSNVQKLEHILKAESEWETLVAKLIALLVKSTDAGVGAIYEWENTEEESFFNLAGSYGCYNDRKKGKKIDADNGQLGELARQRKMIVLENVPAKFLIIHSGLGSASATHVIMAPLVFKNELYGAVELGFFRKPDAAEIQWLERACESIAAHFFNHKINKEAKHQLEVLAQRQAAELVEIHTLQQQTYRKLELKLQEMEEEKRKNEVILEGCVDGVLVFDTTGNINFCNQAATEILETKKSNILGQPVTSLFPVVMTEDEGQWKVVCHNLGAAKEISVRTEASLALSNQTDIDVLITCTQARLQSGVVFTFFIQKISADLF